MRTLLSAIGFLALALFAGYAVTQFSAWHLFLGIVALFIFFISFLNVEFSLYLLIFSMLLSPEFVAGSTGGSSLGRGVTLRFEDFLLIIIGAGWFARNAVYKDIGLFLKTPLNKPLFIYLFVCVLSTGLGIMAGNVDPKTGMFFVLKYFEYFIVFFMVVNYVHTDDQARRMVYFLLVTCFIVALVGLFQIPGGGRVTAPFEGESGEPNTFGGYLMFMLAITAGLFLLSDNYNLKRMVVLLAAVIIPPFLFTQSRVSYLALPVMLIVVSLFTRKKGFLLAFVLVMMAMSPFFLPAVVKQRVAYTFRQTPQSEAQVSLGKIRLDPSTSARILSAKQAIADWTKRPILGYGITGHRFIDSQFPRVLVESGVVGLSFFIFLIYSIFKMAFNSLRLTDSSFYRGLCAGYIAGTAGLLVHALGANTFIIVRIMEPFWFFTGIVFLAPTLKTAAGFGWERE
ncbi:MAG: O-antigen ligase family protein [Thermodesulfobacteriota bacterium]